MRKFAMLVALLLLLPLAACDTGGAGGAPNTITMGSSDFVGSTNISVTAGQAVTFSDPSGSGGIHDLVTGTNGTFTAAAGAPSEFSSAGGVNFSPGDSKSITFATAGTYNITCRIHPNMQATITVS